MFDDFIKTSPGKLKYPHGKPYLDKEHGVIQPLAPFSPAIDVESIKNLAKLLQTETEDKRFNYLGKTLERLLDGGAEV